MYRSILIPIALDHEELIAPKLATARNLMSEGGRITLLTVLETIPGFTSEFVTVKSENHLTQKVMVALQSHIQGAKQLMAQIRRSQRDDTGPADRSMAAQGQGDGSALEGKPYDGRRLSYASTFTNPVQRRMIQTIELATAKMSLLRRIRRFEGMGVPHGQAFWAKALGVMGIEIQTPAAEIAHIPQSGPVVVTANHPHGLVDGMVLAEIIGRVRQDCKFSPARC